MSQYQARLEKIWDCMDYFGVALLMFEDSSARRNSCIRWLTGHPGDALLFLSANKKSMLVPWDVNLAKAYSRADFIVPYNDFERLPVKAILGAVGKLEIPAGSKIEIPPVTPYPAFLNFIGELPDFDIICREDSVSTYALRRRCVKDAYEIAIIRKAAEITNKIISLLEKNVRSGKIKTEADAAIFIELEARKRGCDGTAFETIAAGQDRSFGIHAFPSWTNAPFAGKGLSILDFGVNLNGYKTDVTLTFARDPNVHQQKMINMVEKAAKLLSEMLVINNDTVYFEMVAEEYFGKFKKRLVHAIGHGIGLDAHEYPYIRNRKEDNWELMSGMVIALEPGLYDPIHGGCRLENDYLLEGNDFEVLTEAKIIQL